MFASKMVQLFPLWSQKSKQRLAKLQARANYEVGRARKMIHIDFQKKLSWKNERLAVKPIYHANFWTIQEGKRRKSSLRTRLQPSPSWMHFWKQCIQALGHKWPWSQKKKLLSLVALFWSCWMGTAGDSSCLDPVQLNNSTFLYLIDFRHVGICRLKRRKVFLEVKCLPPVSTRQHCYSHQLNASLYRYIHTLCMSRIGICTNDRVWFFFRPAKNAVNPMTFVQFISQ